jgi:hypothetical protein
LRRKFYLLPGRADARRRGASGIDPGSPGEEVDLAVGNDPVGKTLSVVSRAPVMSEISAISRRTIAGSAGLAPSLAKGNSETAAQELHGRKALNASFAKDLVHGSAGGSRRR